MKGQEADITKLLLALMVFAGLLFGISTFAVDASSKYGMSGGDFQNVATLNRTSEVIGTVNNITSQIQSRSTGNTFLDVFYFTLNSAISGALLFFQVPFMFLGIIADVSGLSLGIPIPEWVTIIAGAIINIIVLGVIMSAILKSRV